MGSERFCLRWNNHWTNLLRVFNVLRLSETFVDVTVACEGRHLKAHRLVLSACSPYFKDLLVSHPDKHPIIILKDVRFTELQVLVQFIYSGEVAVEKAQLPSLLLTARELQIKGLADHRLSSYLEDTPAAGSGGEKSCGDGSDSPPFVVLSSKVESFSLNGGGDHHHRLPPPPPPPPPTRSSSSKCLRRHSSSFSSFLPLVPSPSDEDYNDPVVPSVSFIPSFDAPSVTTSTTPPPPTISSVQGGLCGGATISAQSSSPSSDSGRLHAPLSVITCHSGISPVHKKRKTSFEGEQLPLPRDLTPSPPPPPSMDEPADLSMSSLQHSKLVLSPPTPKSPKKLKVEVSAARLHSPTNTEDDNSPNALTPPKGDPVRRPFLKTEEQETVQRNVSSLSSIAVKTEHPIAAAVAATDDNYEDDGEPLNLQTPDAAANEGPSSKFEDTLNGSALIQKNAAAVHHHAKKEVSSSHLSPPPHSVVPSQISFLQQALAMGYHSQPLPFLPQAGGTALPPAGLMQAKNILSFVDLLKVMGASGGVTALSQNNVPNVSVPNSDGAKSPVVSTDSGSLSCLIAASRSASPGEAETNILTCHICARIMPSLQVLEEHVRIHEEEKPYKCDQCGQRYKYQSAFQRHQEQNHTAKLPGDKPYRCDVCGQCFKYHKSFTKHRANHDLLDSFMKNNDSDDGKGAIRALQESYLQRLLNPSSFVGPHHQTPLAIHGSLEVKEEESESSASNNSKSPCLVSSTSLPAAFSENGDYLKDDDEEVDEGEDIEVEDVVSSEAPCQEGVGDEEGVDEPGASLPGGGDGQRLIICVRCKLTFRDGKSFEGHCRLSPSCSKSSLKEISVAGEVSVLPVVVPTSSGGNLSPPASPHQPSSSDKSLASLSSAGPSTSAVLTSSSSGTFSSPSMLYTLVGGLGGALPPTSVPPNILNLSKLVNFGGISNYSSALRGGGSESMPFSFPPPVLPGLNPSSCANSATAGAATAAAEEERPFKCPYCQKGFKGRENLKLHIRTHTGEKPYNCGVCGKAFGGRSDMNRHLRIHTGEKPYPCKVCGKKFARADYLSKHITTHLGIPFAKPVHSLQQSLQNLENMQNLHNLESLSTGGHLHASSHFAAALHSSLQHPSSALHHNPRGRLETQSSTSPKEQNAAAQ